jgi:hypothetical protein
MKVVANTSKISYFIGTEHSLLCLKKHAIKLWLSSLLRKQDYLL